MVALQRYNPLLPGFCLYNIYVFSSIVSLNKKTKNKPTLCLLNLIKLFFFLDVGEYEISFSFLALFSDDMCSLAGLLRGCYSDFIEVKKNGSRCSEKNIIWSCRPCASLIWLILTIFLALVGLENYHPLLLALCFDVMGWTR